MDASLVWQLIASTLTLGSIYAYGNNSRWGAYLGVASEVPWFAIMILGDLWGLLPLNAVCFFMHARNIWKMK